MANILFSLKGQAVSVRGCGDDDVGTVLDLWSAARSSHAITPDRREDVEALLGESPAVLLVRAAGSYFRDRRVGRVTALVSFDDAAASSFWDAAGYPQDQEIGRRVRNI